MEITSKEWVLKKKFGNLEKKYYFILNIYKMNKFLGGGCGCGGGKK